MLRTRSLSSNFRRSVSQAALAAALLTGSLANTTTWAQEAPAATQLQTLWDDFLHYSLIGQFDLAKETGQAILNAKAAPADLLAAVEAAAGDRNVTTILYRDARQEALHEIAIQLRNSLEKGHQDQARDPARIKAEIERLILSPKAYLSARARLAAAGPYAVPYFIQYLQDEKRKEFHPRILQALGEIGRPALDPLVELLAMPAQADKIALVRILGTIGYPQALPYLKQMVQDPKVIPELQAACDQAIAAIDRRGQARSTSAATLFTDLSESYYYHRPTVSLPSGSEAAYPVWFYDKGLNNVMGVPVPTPVWFDIQAMRAAEAALRIEPANAKALTLWLLANLRREINLPANATDPTRKENDPGTLYYAVAAGPALLNQALALALADRNSPLILKLITALDSVAGSANLLQPSGQGPLAQALYYPDRAVRFAAATTLARANPNRNFPASVRVVPILAEALGRSSSNTALLIEPDEANRNRLKEILRGANLEVIDGATLSAALANTRGTVAVEVILAAGDSEVQQVQKLAANDYRLTNASLLILSTATPSGDAVKGVRTISPTITDKELLATCKEVRAEVGSSAIDAEVGVKNQALATQILSLIAFDHASIYDLRDAMGTLIDALKEKKVEQVTAMANILAQIRHPEAQKALALGALNTANESPVRLALLGALAESAKRLGNQLDTATIETLTKELSSEGDAAMRTASAQALGALNVSTQTAQLILLNASR